MVGWWDGRVCAWLTSREHHCIVDSRYPMIADSYDLNDYLTIDCPPPTLAPLDSFVIQGRKAEATSFRRGETPTDWFEFMQPKSNGRTAIRY